MKAFFLIMVMILIGLSVKAQNKAALGTIVNNINAYITQVTKGTLAMADVPISLDQYMKFLPFVDPTKSLNINDPLPNLIKTTGASSALMNLFPYFMNGDVSGAELARSLFEKYAINFFTDTSYDINLKFNHKSESERRIAETIAKSMLNPLGHNPHIVSGNGGYDGNTYGKAPESRGHRGEVEERALKLSGSTDGTRSTSSTDDGSGKEPVSSTPATMDWKERSKQICDQISKRGLNPNDYGCLKDTKAVDENFSFRGYARMVCSRLETNYDPGIPELCGCPPPTWRGWRP
jgi:hypothetical protein